MTGACALDVMNRLAAAGRIGNYAIAGDAIAWRRIAPTLTEYVDILVSPAADAPRSAGPGYLRALMADQGYGRRDEYGLGIEGSDMRFTVADSALDREALDLAIERLLPIEDTDRSVRGRILRPAHLVARMIA